MILVAHSSGFASLLALAGLQRGASTQPRPPRPTHRFALGLDAGRSETVAPADSCVSVRCTRGRIWITQDGDPRDVVLEPGDSYTADRGDRLLLHALRPSALEMQVGWNS